MNQLEMLKVFMPDKANDTALLQAALDRAELIILNRRYPHGYPDGTVMESRYKDVQISIALELINKMGSEGETGHGEAGVSRSYESAGVSESLLRQIVPLAKCTFKTSEDEEAVTE